MPYILDESKSVLELMGDTHLRKIAARNRAKLLQESAATQAKKNAEDIATAMPITVYARGRSYATRKAGVVISGEASTKRHRVVRSKKSPAVKVKRRRK
jgi:hypothetical protein